MAVALVGSAGAVSTVSAATVTPAFGQATTAGNLLVACVRAGGSTSAITVSGATGWLQAIAVTESTNTGHGVSIWYKPNCGAAETAPTFSCSGAGNMAAALSEWSGAATIAPLDQTGSTAGTASPVTVTATASDISATDLVIVATGWRTTAGATRTWTNSTGYTELADDGTVSSQTHLQTAYRVLTNGGASADSDTVTIGSGSVTNAPAVIASFTASKLLFAVTGNGTWTAPTGVTSLQVECWGAGAGGGGGGTSSATGAGGGGAGAYSSVTVPVTAGTTYNYTVGTAGTAGTGGLSPTAGGNGGDTYFGNSSAGSPTGATCLAKGGTGGPVSNSSGTVGGGAGGQSSSGTGTALASGGSGGGNNGAAGGGGGGGAAGPGGNGNTGGNNAGGGGVGASGNPNTGTGGAGGAATAAGTIGSTYGGAGGGGGNGAAGGAGTQGVVQITPMASPLTVATPQTIFAQSSNRASTF